MKQYEIIFILNSTKVEAGVKAFMERFVPFIQELGGAIVTHQDMGQRQFTHPIKKQSSGHYLDVVVQVAADRVAAIKEKFRLDSSILRLELFHYVEPPKAAQNVERKAFAPVTEDEL